MKLLVRIIAVTAALTGILQSYGSFLSFYGAFSRSQSASCWAYVLMVVAPLVGLAQPAFFYAVALAKPSDGLLGVRRCGSLSAILSLVISLGFLIPTLAAFHRAAGPLYGRSSSRVGRRISIAAFGGHCPEGLADAEPQFRRGDCGGPDRIRPSRRSHDRIAFVLRPIGFQAAAALAARGSRCGFID